VQVSGSGYLLLCTEQLLSPPSIHFGNKGSLVADNIFPILEKFRISFLSGSSFYSSASVLESLSTVYTYYFETHVRLFQALNFEERMTEKANKQTN